MSYWQVEALAILFDHQLLRITRADKIKFINQKSETVQYDTMIAKTLRIILGTPAAVVHRAIFACQIRLGKAGLAEGRTQRLLARFINLVPYLKTSTTSTSCVWMHDVRTPPDPAPF
jgi:hypothetical protein